MIKSAPGPSERRKATWSGADLPQPNHSSLQVHKEVLLKLANTKLSLRSVKINDGSKLLDFRTVCYTTVLW